MKTLVLGGIKSGKSQLAVSLATETNQPVTLIATATAQDDEMRTRIEKHRETRAIEWRTIEEPITVGTTLRQLGNDNGCIVLDCLTLWLTNLLLLNNEQEFQHEKQSLIDAVDTCSASLIVVSNETSMGIIPMGELSRRYCDEVGILHQELAKLSDTVFLTVAGLPLLLKGQTQ